MSYYWTAYHQDLIHEYYYAAFTGGTTSGETQNKCLTLLYPVFVILANKVLWRLGWSSVDKNIHDENIQQCIIIMSYQLLPKLRGDKLQCVLHFLYKGLRWALITEIKKVANRQEFSDINNQTLFASDTYEADYHVNIEDTKRMILNKIDKKIIEQKVINKTASILLIYMKEYLIQNNMDPRGFNEYVKKKMNIKESTYSALISRMGIRRKPFNEKLIKDNDGKDK